ncbi:SRPBCC family protein [Dactylosporangium sp. NPDC049525]|uniref:SRPBCC family protein n=1 Tax=Dactylosporangium sp. NPDC049525 TaxID=3154730 RepID=UPI00343BE9DB
MTTFQQQALRLHAEIVIERPAQVVWDVLADYGNDAAWRRGVTSMVPTPAGPVHVGTTTDEHMRVAGGRYHNLGVVTAVGPGLRFAWRTTSGADADGSRTVTPTAAGACLVHLELNVRLHGAQRLAAPLFRATLRRNLTADVERLRGLVESEAVTPRRSGARPTG